MFTFLYFSSRPVEYHHQDSRQRYLPRQMHPRHRLAHLRRGPRGHSLPVQSSPLLRGKAPQEEAVPGQAQRRRGGSRRQGDVDQQQEQAAEEKETYHHNSGHHDHNRKDDNAKGMNCILLLLLLLRQNCKVGLNHFSFTLISRPPRRRTRTWTSSAITTPTTTSTRMTVPPPPPSRVGVLPITRHRTTTSPSPSPQLSFCFNYVKKKATKINKKKYTREKTKWKFHPENVCCSELYLHLTGFAFPLNDWLLTFITNTKT